MYLKCARQSNKGKISVRSSSQGIFHSTESGTNYPGSLEKGSGGESPQNETSGGERGGRFFLRTMLYSFDKHLTLYSTESMQPALFNQHGEFVKCY